MPKRTTHSYTSEDAGFNAPVGAAADLTVYYCKHCATHVLILDTTLQKLPRRKTDNAYVIDTSKHIAKLNTEEGGKCLLKRADDKVERQWRMKCSGCQLFVAYRSEEEKPRLIYLVDGALSGLAQEGDPKDAPIPPCIQQVSENAVQVAIEVEDNANKTLVVRVNADDVLLAVAASSRGGKANAELMTFMAKLLGIRLSQMTLSRGWSSRSKLLMVCCAPPPPPNHTFNPPIV
eukprot:jgi/Mesvir1/19686/Mv09955-RA.1